MDRLVWLENISASRRKKEQCFVGDLSFSCFFFLMVAGAWTYKPSGSGLWFRCIALFPSYSFVTTSLPQACCCCSCAFAGGVKDCVKSSNKRLSFQGIIQAVVNLGATASEKEKCTGEQNFLREWSNLFVSTFKPLHFCWSSYLLLFQLPLISICWSHPQPSLGSPNLMRIFYAFHLITRALCRLSCCVMPYLSNIPSVTHILGISASMPVNHSPLPLETQQRRTNCSRVQ